MRINEVVVEQQLDEGPLGSAVGAVGRGIAKGIGGLAKGAGMIAGIGQGVKRAFGKGKATSAAHIAGDVPKQQAAQPSVSQQAYDQEYAKLTKQPQATQGAAAPAQGGGAPAAQGGAPAAQPTAQPAAQGGAQQKVEPTMQQQPAAGGSDVDAIIQQVDQLQPPEKKEVLAALQKPAAPAKEQPAADANATPKPAAQPAAQGGNFDAQTGKPTSQTGQDLEQQIQNAKQTAAQKMGRGLSPQEEKEIEGEIRGTMKPKAAAPEDDNPNIVRGTESVQRRGRMIESTQKFILYKPQTVKVPVVESKQSKNKAYTLYRS